VVDVLSYKSAGSGGEGSRVRTSLDTSARTKSAKLPFVQAVFMSLGPSCAMATSVLYQKGIYDEARNIQWK
jgi:hypothetical protein